LSSYSPTGSAEQAVASVDIEAQLRRFELGESAYAKADPMPAAELEPVGYAFAAHYERSDDLRYLNSVLKIVDRSDFKQACPGAQRKLSEWADAMLDVLRRSTGLS
jgi:hypothetical protein